MVPTKPQLSPLKNGDNRCHRGPWLRVNGKKKKCLTQPNSWHSVLGTLNSLCLGLALSIYLVHSLQVYAIYTESILKKAYTLRRLPCVGLAFFLLVLLLCPCPVLFQLCPKLHYLPSSPA